jgi:aminoglycoside phosphotransferase (APT) family kinase protein
VDDLKTYTTKHVSTAEVEKFLDEHHNSPTEKLVHIQEGKHSDAFSYTNDHKEYVARFNTTDEGFLKDEYAHKNFSTPQIVIPRIFAIGQFNENLFFSLSEKVAGETVKEQYGKQDFSSLRIQFETVEAIKNVPISLDVTGFGKWKVGEQINAGFDKYFTEICGGGLSDWSIFYGVSYFDNGLVEYLLRQIQKYADHSSGVRELVHGDFGGGNLLLDKGRVSGVIDWAHSFYGDHFWDIGRIVLFCPNRKETVRAALDFYKDKYFDHKERIAWGVYAVMLKNYRAALTSQNEASCLSSAERIKEFEKHIDL